MLLPSDQGAPKFAAAEFVVADCLRELRYPPKILVSECADEHRILWNPGAYSGLWRESPHDMRFAERAMDGLHADSPYREVVVMGPAQTGKSEVGNNWQLHTVIYDQADMMFVMPDRTSIDQYVKTQWDKMTEHCPSLADRLLGGASADTINLKQFRGCSFFFQWPSGPTFRAKPVSRGRLDDYDDIPQDVGAGAGGKGGQGSPLALMLGRGGSFSAYGGSKVYANSTPKLGARRGIEALVSAGTDERWYVDCLACEQPFILDTEEVLRFDSTGTPAEAAASAEVLCPHPDCGGSHRQKDKAALMRSGRWVGNGETAVSRRDNPAGKEGELLPNSRLSQRWDGLMGFRRWSEMAEQWRSAELKFENEQDETELVTFWQTVIGKNYTPRGSGKARVTEDELIKRARASGHRFGVVPAEARCLIMAVDQAINRFEVAAWAFGPGFRAWLVDRFSIVNCGDEPLRPFTRPEHFSVLHGRVLSKRYPVEGGTPDQLVKVFGTGIDTGGMDGATDNAFEWWHSMVKGDVGSGRAPVPATAITLYKGGNKIDGKLLPPPKVDAKRQMKGAPPCELFVPNANRIKSMADVGLQRSDGGPGSIVFPCDENREGDLIAAPYIAEMTAETLEGEQWVRPQGVPNETLDLYVIARTVLLRFGGHDHSLGWVPGWARPPKDLAAKPEDQRRRESDEASMRMVLREEQRESRPEERPTEQKGASIQRTVRSSLPSRPRVRVRVR